MKPEQKRNLLKEVDKLQARNKLAGNIGPDYFEPGMMEYLEQSYGSYNEVNGQIVIRFESKGTRYDGRTELIEKVNAGDEVEVVRDPENAYNHNNFVLVACKKWDVGNMPAELCNAIAPLYDEKALIFDRAFVSYVEPISKRNRHAKQAVLFVELNCHLTK